MEISALLLTLAFVLPVHTATPAPTSEVLKRYVEAFNQNDTERVETTIPNNAAAAWMQKNIPRFECPEPTLEEIYYILLSDSGGSGIRAMALFAKDRG